MSSDQSNSTDSPAAPSRRRSSFVDLFGPRPPTNTQPTPPRRLSITTLGLSTMPATQTSPFNTMRARAESVSSANSGSVDESPFEDEPSGAPASASMSSSVSSSVPATPFARRMSFGAKVLRDQRNPGSSSPNGTGAPAGSANEGFDFAENLRARAERTSTSGASFSITQPSSQAPHHRSKSAAVLEPPRELPKPKAPDAFQERILKGDFYMD